MASERSKQILESVIQKGSKKSSRLIEELLRVRLKDADTNVKDEVKRWNDEEDELKSKLKGMVFMSTTHYSHSAGTLKGLAYVVSPDMPAKKVIRLADLMGGVSVYKVAKVSSPKDIEKTTHLIRKVMELKEKPVFTDTSLLIQSEQTGFSLSAIDGSIGIYSAKSSDADDLKNYWFIVVRSYHTPSARKVWDYINSDAEPTIDDVYESDEYKEGLALSDKTRDALAYAFATHIGATLADPTTSIRLGEGSKETIMTATPYIHGHYNVIQSIQDYREESVRVFYAGCFGYAEKAQKGLIYGLTRAEGWILITPEEDDNSNLRMGGIDTVFAFPMGNPRKEPNSLNPKPDPSNIPEKARNLIHWGLGLPYHDKAHPGHYHSGWQETEAGKNEFAIMGILGKYKTMKLINRGVYVSSPSEEALDIEELIRYKQSDQLVSIPILHPFVEHYLIQGYIKLKKNKWSGKLSTGSNALIQSESKLYFTMKVEAVRELLAVMKSYQ